jgi:hypothetical protein
MIPHGVIHFLSAEKPETRTGSGWQHERNFVFLSVDRRFAWIYLFKRNKIRAKTLHGKQENPRAIQALNFTF